MKSHNTNNVLLTKMSDLGVAKNVQQRLSYLAAVKAMGTTADIVPPKALMTLNLFSFE